MKHSSETATGKDLAHTSTAPEDVSETTSNTPTSQRRVVSLSDLTSTPPRTPEDIRRAFAEGRVAELKPDQA